MLLSSSMIEDVDRILDEKVAEKYQIESLAQDWARVAKITEEAGEAISELILATGQNPRKPRDLEAWDRMLDELCDVTLTGILAIQHFTKDMDGTARLLTLKLERTWTRLQAIA